MIFLLALFQIDQLRPEVYINNRGGVLSLSLTVDIMNDVYGACVFKVQLLSTLHVGRRMTASASLSLGTTFIWRVIPTL